MPLLSGRGGPVVGSTMWRPTRPDPPSPSGPGVTAGEGRPHPTGRAVVLGLALVAGFAFLIPYLSDVKDGPDLAFRPINGASLLALLLLLGPVNGLLLARARRRGLAASEVLTVYALVAIAAGLSTTGFSSFVTIMATASHYFASPENRWAVLVQPHVPLWLTVNQPDAVRWLWEGLPEHQAIPWRAWWQPMATWGLIGISLCVGSFSLLALMRRDWIESQRLAFPLAQIPLEAVGQHGTPGAALLRQRAFWAGCGPAFLLGLLGLLHRYLPAVPVLSMQWPIGHNFNEQVVPWGVLSLAEFNLDWASLGIMCLLPLEVSLSLWLFHLLYYAAALAFSALGYIGPGTFSYNSGAFGYQTGGALVGFGAFVLWQSRRTISAALRSWWDRGCRRDDPLELLPPRYALLGLGTSTLVLCLLAVAARAQLSRLLALLFLHYTTAISLTRVVAAAGTNHVECGPPVRVLLDGQFGTSGVRPSTMGLLNPLSGAFMTDYSASFMHYAANDMKILHSSRLGGPRAMLALAAAVALMLALGPVGRVWAGYQHGIAGLNHWIYNGIPRWEFGAIAALQTPEPAHRHSILASLSGAVIVIGLALLQIHVPWWRLSPVGFLLVGGWGINALIWANALVGWAIVTTIYCFGGLRLYQQLRPVFIGLFLGASTATLANSAVLLLSGAPAR